MVWTTLVGRSGRCAGCRSGGANYQLGLQEVAAVGEGGVGVGELQGGYLDLVLADGDLIAVARVPLRLGVHVGVLLVIFEVRLRSGDLPGSLVGQADPGGRTQAVFLGDVLQVVVAVGALAIPQVQPDGVEEVVARYRDGGLQVDHAVGGTVVVVGDEVADGDVPGVVEWSEGGDQPGLQAGGGRDELERRSGRVLALNGAVEQRIARIVEQRLVVGLADSADELARVVGGVGGQGQDLAVVGVLDDRRARRCGEVAVGDLVEGVAGPRPCLARGSARRPFGCCRRCSAAGCRRGPGGWWSAWSARRPWNRPEAW